MKKRGKGETEKQIQEFFKNIKSKAPKDVGKIKTLAASKNIKLGELRKKFCKKCLTPYSGKETIKIKDKMKFVACLSCNHLSRWKLNSSTKKNP